jgi:hypothetical protein
VAEPRRGFEPIIKSRKAVEREEKEEIRVEVHPK